MEGTPAMPRRKKDPNEMTDQELMESVFPKRVVREINREIGKEPKDESPPDKKDDKG